MRLLIEGWRGINHSLALANQFQILALLRRPGVALFHRDLPFPMDWDGVRHPAGFTPEDAARIAALPGPEGQAVDAVYRIGAPFRSGPPEDTRRTLTYMVTELGLSGRSFAPDADLSFFTRGENLIVTPSAWSRDRLLDRGFDPGRVRILPHGVDAAVFKPLSGEERALVRGRLGFRPEETIFLNIGGPFWNKGIDILLEAFAALRARGRRARLVLKDQSGLYGVGMRETIARVGERCPALLAEGTLDAISLIQGSLGQAQLRELHGVADAYVSPYRAEGFNLPVLEAIACARPVIVTAGGATDDFCPEPLAMRLPGTPGTMDGESGDPPRRFIEPRLDDLVEAMDGIFRVGPVEPAGTAAARAAILEAFSWDRAVETLLEFAGGAVPPAAALPIVPQAAAAPPPMQEEVLDLLRRLRPRAMQHGRKLRVGNDWDGGYVLPEVALQADVVLSIGVGGDVSFDLEFAKRGARVLQFDHTVECPPAAHENFLFHRLGWGPRTEGPLLGFADMHRRTGDAPGARRLLKFDVEGAEYEALDAADPADLAAYEVIVCELHDLARIGERGHHDLLRRCLDQLTRHHEPVHLHANNYAGMALVQGVPVPEVLELTLLRRDLDVFPGPSADQMPGPLDRPNHPLRPDLCLTAFQA